MQSSQRPPPHSVAAYADRIFVQAVDVPREAPPIPAWTNGFLMLQAGDVFDMQLEGGERLPGYRLMAVGPMTRPTYFADAPVRVRGVAVRLRPGALPRLLGGATLVDATRDLSEHLVGDDRKAPEVGEQEEEEEALVLRATAVLEALIARGPLTPRGTELFGRAMTLIEEGPRDLVVSALAAALSVSTVALRNAFHANVGLPPKRFLRVRRMEQVLESFFDTPDLEYLSRIHGFADQSHFIREFRALCGATPTAFLERVATEAVREVHNNLA
ncbi:MAG: helix-turn-helix domain-containing protein [Polyangiales bacterium]